MSDLTQCNYCKLEAMKWDVKKKGKRVIIIPVNPLKDKYKLGGSNVYIVGRREKPSEANWACWFMQITTVCAC